MKAKTNTPAKKQVASKKGRPSKFNADLALSICETIACSSKSLKTICKELNISPASVLNWLRKDNDFLAQYARAKQDQADFLAEEIIEIADDGSNDLMTIVKGDETYEMENKEVVNRSKLRVEARKWIAAKLKPKKYGDKLDLTSAGEKLEKPDTSRLTVAELTALARLQDKLDAK